MPALTEFALIERYFARPGHASRERQGIGDDCALIDVGDQTLAITKDLLVAGVHFFPDTDPVALGHKALAVNLSDLAAAGARPRCFLLGLALPSADAGWLEAFSRGLFALADAHDCSLVGGDTTRAAPLGQESGTLGLSITAIGTVDRQHYAGRAGARPGDEIWVSGALGGAALGLALLRGELALPPAQRAACLQRLERPEPRVALGLALRGLATAALDVSDGLLGDLGHILHRSGVGAQVQWPALPLEPALQALPLARQQQCALAGGDDYELLFTAPAAAHAAVAALASPALALCCIGRIEALPGLRLVDAAGGPIDTTLHAYDHFPPPIPR